MVFATFAFVVIFLMIASGGLLLFYRGAMIQRIAEVIAPRQKKGLVDRLQETGSSIGGVLQQFQRAVPKSEAEMSVIQQRLARAGYRDDAAKDLFYGSKFVAPVGLALLALITGVANFAPLFVYGLCLGLGFLLPDFVLDQIIKNRQKKIRRGLPDVLDLLIICIEAGLSLDQATARAADELKTAQPVISDELNMVVLEQRAGRIRTDCWRHLADRTGVESVRNVAAVLIQSEKFGTSVAKSLRVHSETLRTQRRQQVEEQAAKTTVKLVFPLVLLIFPSIFVVTLGPAVIIMMESFQQYLTK